MKIGRVEGEKWKHQTVRMCQAHLLSLGSRPLFSPILSGTHLAFVLAGSVRSSGLPRTSSGCSAHQRTGTTGMWPLTISEQSWAEAGASTLAVVWSRLMTCQGV